MDRSGNMADIATFLYESLLPLLLRRCLLLLPLLCFLALVGKGIYNRYFHPLSKFPGPFWASVTDLYLAFFITSVPTFGLELHKKHG